VEITDTSFGFSRERQQIEREAALDGIYVLRTSVPDSELEAPNVVRAYKQLKEVERAFREPNGPLELYRIHHRLEDSRRIARLPLQARLLPRLHLRQAWAELIVKDEGPPTQADPVAKPGRSATGRREAQTKRTAAGEPCHSLTTPLTELSIRPQHDPPARKAASFEQITEPTTTRPRAPELIDSSRSRRSHNRSVRGAPQNRAGEPKRLPSRGELALARAVRHRQLRCVRLA
jgi:hypothetical protein